jgi:hypothetical protein
VYRSRFGAQRNLLCSDVSTKPESSKLYIGQGVRRFKPPPFYHSSAKRIRDDIALRIYFILLESSLERLPAPVQTKSKRKTKPSVNGGR